METLRRLLIVLFTLAAVITWFAPAKHLYLMELVDFKYELEHHPYPWKHKGKSVSQYLEEVTKNRTYKIPPGQWQNIAVKIGSSKSNYIKSNNQILQEFIPHFAHRISKIYLKNVDKNNFISVRRLSPQDYYYKKAPNNYKTPYYLWCPVLLLIGILFYIFLPQYHFSDDTLHYGTGFSAVIGPDIVGLFVISGFFTLGIGVGLSGASGGILTLFSSNLIPITCVLWAFTLFGFYMLYTGAKYAGLGLTCSSQGIKRFSHVGVEIISPADIDSVKLGHWKASKWLVRFGFLISLFNWRALGPTLLNTSRNDPLLEVHLKDGRVWSYDLASAQNVKKVLLCLQKNGVDVEPQLIKIIS